MTAPGTMPPLRLGPEATSLLILVAGYRGLSPEEWVSKAIATEAEAIGLQTLTPCGEPLEVWIGGKCVLRGGNADRERGTSGPVRASAPAGRSQS